MKASKATKNARAGKWIFWSLSFLANFGLILGFFIWGLVCGTETTRYTMCLAGVVGVVLGTVSLLLKKHWRTPLVIVMAGLYYAISQFAPVLIALAVSIVADELVFSPLYHYFKSKTQINHEIDKRLGD